MENIKFKSNLIILCCLFFQIGMKAQSTTPIPTGATYVVPNIDWAWYNGDHTNLSTVPAAMDGFSSVYSTGYAQLSSTLTVMRIFKVDSLGVPAFTVNYSNGSYDAGNAIKIDASGNSYITGISYSSGSNRDYITMKYSPTGTQLWVKFYNGSGNGIDEAMDLKLDASGNVYVTGRSKNSAGDYDIITIKYNNSGTQQWVHTFAGTAAKDDQGVGLVLSSNGHTVYVTGSTTNSTPNTDIVTYAINASTGASIWSMITNGTANSVDMTNAITLSGANVVISGYLYNNTTTYDYVTIKYNGSTGSIMWQKGYDFGNADNRASALVKDSTGNIAVTGTAKNGALVEIHTLLYDSLGNQLWVNKEVTGLSGLNVAPHVATDTVANHFYIAGQFMNATADCYAYQITPTGNTIWKKSYDGIGAGTDAACNLVVNGIGVVYLAAQCKNMATKYDYTIIKVSQTPVYFPNDYGTPEINDKGFLFQENKGQLLHTTGSAVTPTEVAYYNQSRYPPVYINTSKISYLAINSNTTIMLPDSAARVDMDLTGANQLAQIYKYNQVDAKKNYFTTSANGITGVGSFERLFIPDIYSNIDLHHYSNTRGLKSYFVCKVARTVDVPRFSITGALSTTINANGELLALTNLGTINYGKLTAYQATVNPSTYVYTLVPVSSASWQSLGSNTYKFNVTGYNPAIPLIVYLSKAGVTSVSAPTNVNNMYWSTFIGDVGDDQTKQSKVDAKDNYYRAGYTTAINFPALAGGFQNVVNNSSGITYGILNKFDSQGKAIHSTLFGGANPTSKCGNPTITQMLDVAIDSLYNIYMVGLTTATNMAIQSNTLSGALNYTANAANTNISGGCTNAFIAKINPSGNTLLWSSYYGGNTNEKFTCAKYMNGQIYLGGISVSPTIPLVSPQPNAYQISSGSGLYMHLDTLGVIKHNTKIQNQVISGDADKAGNYYLISGFSNVAVPNLAPAATFYTASIAGGLDWAVQRFSPADSLNWSFAYGGNAGNDYPTAICIRDSVMAICGKGDGNFPIVKTASDSGDIAHVYDFEIQLVKFNLKTGQRLWSVMHATGNTEYPYGVTLDKNYNLFVTGYLYCSACPGGGNFKTIAPTGYYTQTVNISNDAFVLGYNSQNQRKWTTRFGSLNATNNGGFNEDEGYAISVNSANKLFIGGITNSKNNSLPLARWNTVCYYDSTAADLYPSSLNDGFITMFDVGNFRTVGIKENTKGTEISSNISLFPNPNKGTFTLRFKEQPDSKLNVSVINILGQNVFELQNFKPDSDELYVNLGNLKSGIYFITINENSAPHTIKFIVE